MSQSIQPPSPPTRIAPAGRGWLRASFGHTGQNAQSMPNLIEVQRNSYDRFLQQTPGEGRDDLGLHAIFQSVFPIQNFSGTAQLEYAGYAFGEPKYDVEECRHRGMTYEAPLKLSLRLIVFDVDEATGNKAIRNVKEQDIYMGEIPLMIEHGTFIINGAERVVVSQMHRSPGVFFDHDKGKTHSSGKLLFSARIIPYRGSWLDFEFDVKDILYARIDRRRKIPSTLLLRAMGMTTEKILEIFYPVVKGTRSKKGHWHVPFMAEKWQGVRPVHDLIDARTGEVIAAKDKRITRRQMREMAEANIAELLVPKDVITGERELYYLAKDVPNVNAKDEPIARAGDVLNEELLETLEKEKINEIEMLDVAHSDHPPFMRNTAAMDKCDTPKEALDEIYRVMRPGDSPAHDAAKELFKKLFFDAERYDLSAVGRVKLNLRFNLDAPDDCGVLREEDIIAVVRKLVDLRSGNGEVDDIDSLSNRRVRSVGELMENQYRVGLLRVERAVRERMSSGDIDGTVPQDLINAKLIVALVREFFGSSQLSQFMDQTNPLSEVTHKRRLSALGPGGLTRERAGFAVRDVHPTHYGRICPVETPEGPNIGLINSLATHARINQYGLLETPYRRVRNGKVSDEVEYLSAMEEGQYRIAQASVVAQDGSFLQSEVNCRVDGGFETVPPEEVGLVDVSPCQIVSVAAALIPFLENDDANRALMGSNMQRQAVPLIRSEAPFVGTGLESVIAHDSGAAVIARRSGTVDQVDARRIFIRADEVRDASRPGVDIYNLRKFQRSNQSTCINQRPLVQPGQHVNEGEIIADGPAIDHGELALGRNVLAAFMPWDGYNFEDSIILSERLVQDDVFTSIHIEEYEVMARDTKLGPEEITRDVPNASEETLKNLDEVGIAYVGARVEAGSILVGKTTPKSETPMTPEEKLLRSIFGEKASEVRDTSLRLPPGTSGTVVEVRVFNRHGVEKDERALAIAGQEMERLARDRDGKRRVFERNTYRQLKDLLAGKIAASGPDALSGGGKITEEILDAIPRAHWWDIALKQEKAGQEMDALRQSHEKGRKELDDSFNYRIQRMQDGDDLPPGVMKSVKVFVAVKRKIQQGDKMAGRHGNKGVISRIAPVEDMPHLEDGTPVDIILNPLGVPSRMNVGQILETHLGWACAAMGKKIAQAVNLWQREQQASEIEDHLKQIYPADHPVFTSGQDEMVRTAKILADEGVRVATPVFDGAHEEDIVNLLAHAGVDTSGQMTLYDGRTGEKFQRPVTVGYIYMLKLHHLVDDKIHARSTGPYSLVTQQPLGGKAQFGGQRFGEMEVWALEAYGAGYTLREMLTIKSDDVAGRTKTYEDIVGEKDSFDAGVPESFNVLVMEMQALGLNVELLQDKQVRALPTKHNDS